MPAKIFSAILEARRGKSVNYAAITIPFDSAKVWKTRRALRVKGEINGFPFRTSLLPTGDGRHVMVVNKAMQKGARIRPGMEVRLRMEPDTEERIAPIATELETALKASRQLQKYYASLTPSIRRDFAQFVADGKQAGTRVRRAEQIAERLMETMEAEQDLPPLLRHALAQNPKAAAAWNRMSPSHRRRYLLVTFHYRDPQSRLRWFEKAIEQMMSEPRTAAC
jgi:uncharacterized protein YdeI (YjbR/CyaY-like superfamily)